MRIEHIAMNVPQPFEMADWYVSQLGMTVTKRSESGCFIADGSGLLMEIYFDSEAPLIESGRLHPQSLHLAFAVEDVAAARSALVTAGGSAEGEMRVTPGGDTLAFVRDPWGNVLQLVSRGS